MSDGIPRRTVLTDPFEILGARIRELEERCGRLERANNLNNASISGVGNNIVAYDNTGAAILIMGALVHTAPGSYGLEIYNAGVWHRIT